MVNMLNRIGSPRNQNLVFMGDYVDRGMFSVEVILTLFALKINYPDKVILLRGNHESRVMTTFYSFRKEVLYKYDDQLYDMFMECFDTLPLACLIASKFLVIHGGLSPQLKKLEYLNQINRFQEPPVGSLLSDILWSDPVSDDQTDQIYDY